MKKIYSLLIVTAVCFATVALAQETNKSAPIKVADMAAAAKLFDLNFTQQELDTMYDGIQENLLNYRLMHKQTLANSVPMSLWQSPLLPGMVIDTRKDNIRWKFSTTEMPANKNDLAFYSVAQLSYLLKNKKNQLR